MPVKVVVMEYIDKLKGQERKKPVHERRPIPTVEEMAKAAGISKTGFIDFAHNRTKGINRDLIDSVITQLRACGYDTQLTDVIQYFED